VAIGVGIMMAVGLGEADGGRTGSEIARRFDRG
jgi:hypothetical protein